jgi:glycosyltransferase involved in cell wall biosynthesis
MGSSFANTFGCLQHSALLRYAQDVESSHARELSVFFPAYNEEANVRATAEGILRILPSVADRYELLIVDDGSVDDTGPIADALADANPLVRVIHHPTNRGYGGAIRTGLYNCRYALMAFIDGDGQFDFAEIPAFLAASMHYDLVIGYRVRRQDSFIRRLNAQAWGLLMRVIFGLRVRDIDCAFKLINKDALFSLPRLRSDGAMVSAELLVRSRDHGLSMTQVPVHHLPRRDGEQTGANLGVILKAFRDLWSLWRALHQ